MREATYLNPLYLRPFPDPFVLKHCGVYWGYATGRSDDGRCFGVMRSPDLVRWEECSGALDPPLPEATCYWAPEVRYENGQFLMYYSVGDEERMEIRVAASDRPDGPFADCGRRLTSEEFAIDPHVFVDDDGARYLFYATDFLTHTHVGTGTVCDRMLDHWTLAGRPRPVTRARYDWHVYDPQRAAKGGVRWHTVEGPFVLKRKARYFQMFSAGNWQNPSYGVCYAVAGGLDEPGEWTQACDGARVLPILRTVPGRVVGPGHNSAVRGPDNRQMFCVYHRWAEDQSGRLLAIDRLDWAGDRLLVLGPSLTPRPAPLAPGVADVAGGELVGRRSVATLPAAFVAEVSLRAAQAEVGGGAYGVSLGDEGDETLRCLIRPRQQSLIVTRPGEEGRGELRLDLPGDFRYDVFHLLRLEVNGGMASLELDGRPLRWRQRGDGPRHFALIADGTTAAYAGLALTEGWEDLFTEGDLEEWGWRVEGGGGWRIADRRLLHSDGDGAHVTVSKGVAWGSYELVVNARLDGGEGHYGFYPARGAEGWWPLLTVERAEGGWAVLVKGPTGERAWPLPSDFDPGVDQQFRLRKRGESFTLEWEGALLGEAECVGRPECVALYAHQAAASFEMVRVTAIEE